MKWNEKNEWINSHKLQYELNWKWSYLNSKFGGKVQLRSHFIIDSRSQIVIRRLKTPFQHFFISTSSLPFISTSILILFSVPLIRSLALRLLDDSFELILPFSAKISKVKESIKRFNFNKIFRPELTWTSYFLWRTRNTDSHSKCFQMHRHLVRGFEKVWKSEEKDAKLITQKENFIFELQPEKESDSDKDLCHASICLCYIAFFSSLLSYVCLWLPFAFIAVFEIGCSKQKAWTIKKN